MSTILVRDVFDIAPGIMTLSAGSEANEAMVIFPPSDGNGSSWVIQKRSLRQDYGQIPTIQDGDLLVSFKSNQLRTLIASKEHKGLVPSKSVAVFSSKDKNEALVSWLQFWLNSSDFRIKHIDSISRSTGGVLSPSWFWNVEMPKPSEIKLLELQKMTNLLDRAEKDLELTLSKIKKLREVEVDILFSE